LDEDPPSQDALSQQQQYHQEILQIVGW